MTPNIYSCFDQSYFRDGWNTFDFITVVGSIVDALMMEFEVSPLSLGLQFNGPAY